MKKYSTPYKIITILQSFRAVIQIMLFVTSPSRATIEKDLDRWALETNDIDGMKFGRKRKLVWFLWRYPEYRNLFYYRIKRDGGFVRLGLLVFARYFFPPLQTLNLDIPTLGEGFFIQHGYSTIISAEKIGKNCWVNQQVTIGYSNNTDRPTLGDNVHITAGAKVIGKVKVGDNSIIGANAVVVKDVPPNCTVVGVPAYIVRRNDRKIRESL